MGWIVFTILAVVAFAATWKLRIVTTENSYGGTVRSYVRSSDGFPIVAFPIVVAYAIFTLLLSVNTIEAGHIGLVRTFGEYTGQQSPGLNFKAPYQSVDEVNGRVQKASVSMTGGDHGSAVSKETQPVYAQITVNYQIELNEARELYSNVGENYYHAIIEPRVQQAFKAITVKYATADIAPHREEIRDQAKTILERQLHPFGITVNDLLIKNLNFSKAFIHAIEEKQVAGQKALAAEARVATSKAKAQQRIATAEGKARATQIEGSAIKLNPQILELRRIEKLNPNVQVIYLPSDTNMLLNAPK